jgi:hypothetical protein
MPKHNPDALPSFPLPKLTAIPGIRAPRGWGLKTTAARSRILPRLGAVPSWWWKSSGSQKTASEILYQTLLSLGLKPNTDFLFDTTVSGIHVDALVPQMGIALVLQGEKRSTASGERQQAFSELQLKQSGLRLVRVNTTSLLSDPVPLVRAALNGTPHIGIDQL